MTRRVAHKATLLIKAEPSPWKLERFFGIHTLTSGIYNPRLYRTAVKRGSTVLVFLKLPTPKFKVKSLQLTSYNVVIMET